MNRERHREASHPRACRGAALLIMLLVLTLAFGTTLIISLNEIPPEIAQRNRTLAALTEAKQALITWSVLQGDLQPATEVVGGVPQPTYYRPGNLPCPDGNHFGDSNTGYASGSCSAGGNTSIGRLPWKSLGVERLRDANGESLWYAVSDSFRTANDLNNKAINSDTKGSLLLYGTDGTSLTTPPGEELAAIIFAPGLPLEGQDRSALPDAASSYLEAFAGKNNASAAGPFVMGPAKDSIGNLVINDLVIGITARELISAMEKRALKEAQNALLNYKTALGSFPSPAPYSGANCTSTVTNVKSVALCASDSTTCFGRLPEDILSPYVALWFQQNGWGRVMTYVIHSGAACTTPIKVGTATNEYVLIAPGSARDGQNRPSTSLSNYLEDSENMDAWSADPNFSLPSVNSNDQLRSSP